MLSYTCLSHRCFYVESRESRIGICILHRCCFGRCIYVIFRNLNLAQLQLHFGQMSRNMWNMFGISKIESRELPYSTGFLTMEFFSDIRHPLTKPCNAHSVVSDSEKDSLVITNPVPGHLPLRSLAQSKVA